VIVELEIDARTIVIQRVLPRGPCLWAMTSGSWPYRAIARSATSVANNPAANQPGRIAASCPDFRWCCAAEFGHERGARAADRGDDARGAVRLLAFV